MKRQAEKIYSEYQANIRAAGEGRPVILNGLQEGRDVERLFLQAAEVIGRLTGDADVPRRVREELLTVYGVGLAEEVPRRMQREAV